MEQNDEFIRVGTTYYKIVDQPLVNGETVKRRIPWSIEALRQDYGKNFIADIPKFDGFCTVPNHLDYNREVGTFYNLYEPIIIWIITERLELSTICMNQLHTNLKQVSFLVSNR